MGRRRRKGDEMNITCGREGRKEGKGRTERKREGNRDDHGF